MANGLCKYCGLPSNIGIVGRYYLSSSIDQTVANYCRMSLPSGTKNRLQKEVWGGFGLAKKKSGRRRRSRSRTTTGCCFLILDAWKIMGLWKCCYETIRHEAAFATLYSIAPAPARHYYTLVMNLPCSSPDLRIWPEPLTHNIGSTRYSFFKDGGKCASLWC